MESNSAISGIGGEMTESQKRFLTSYLGECWHELDGEIEDDGVYRTGCVHCGADSHDAVNRTFTDLKDKQDLLDRLSPEDFADFMDFASDCWNEIADKAKPYMGSYHSFTRWLFRLSPIETAELICRWKNVKARWRQKT